MEATAIEEYYILGQAQPQKRSEEDCGLAQWGFMKLHWIFKKISNTCC
jgi:hypothetical protein